MLAYVEGRELYGFAHHRRIGRRPPFQRAYLGIDGR